MKNKSEVPTMIKDGIKEMKNSTLAGEGISVADSGSSGTDMASSKGSNSSLTSSVILSVGSVLSSFFFPSFFFLGLILFLIFTFTVKTQKNALIDSVYSITLVRFGQRLDCHGYYFIKSF